MKTFITLLFTLVLLGCVMVTIPVSVPEERTGAITCRALSIPSLEPVPDVPVIPATVAKDRGKTEDVLVAKIKELRDYGKNAQDVLDRLRTEQRQCR